MFIFTMKIIVILSCVLAVTLADSEWEAFKLQYGRKYSSPTEESNRQKIFMDNKMTIEKHNHQFKEGKTTFTLGINQFADMTNEEFKANSNKYILKEKVASNAQYFGQRENPATVDWRDTGCVTAVKDQGQCGSCWAFAATESAEFANCQAKREPVTCSVYELMDCSWSYGNLGCNGGIMDMGFQYIVDHGLDSQGRYPYSDDNPLNCPHRNATDCTLSSYKDVTPYGSERALETAVATIAPVAAAIDASHASFQLYSSGVYDEPLCSPTQLDHSVFVVGYGVDGGLPYWLVKNSWGISWGTQGYIEMSNLQCRIKLVWGPRQKYFSGPWNQILCLWNMTSGNKN